MANDIFPKPSVIEIRTLIMTALNQWQFGFQNLYLSQDFTLTFPVVILHLLPCNVSLMKSAVVSTRLIIFQVISLLSLAKSS